MRRLASLLAALLVALVVVASPSSVTVAPGGIGDPSAVIFRVQLEGVTLALLREVSGLQGVTEVVPTKGKDPFALEPGRTRFGNIVLVQGITAGSELADWYRDVTRGTLVRKDGAVEVLASDLTSIAVYEFTGAWPARYTVRRDDSGLLLEEIELVIETLVRTD